MVNGCDEKKKEIDIDPNSAANFEHFSQRKLGNSW